MPSSFTTYNRLTKQATGENTNTWGIILNAVLDLIDFSMDGMVALAATTTLTSANGATDQARARALNYTGMSAGIITIPAVSHVYVVRAATANCTISNGASSVTVLAGSSAIVMTDGATVWIVQNYDFNSQRLTRIATPIANTDAANRKYVDDAAFASITNLPGQAGNAGKVLGTDGTNASWVPSLPDQTGQAGEFLTTDGTTAAWVPISQATLTNINAAIATGRTDLFAFSEHPAGYSSGAIDTATGSVFTAAISANTTVSLANLPASLVTGQCVTINGEITITGTPVITWPAGITWFNSFTISAGLWMLTIKARWSGSAWVYVGTMVKSV